MRGANSGFVVGWKIRIMNTDDRNIKACFRDLKEADAALAPAFAGEIELARARCRVEPRFGRAYLAVAATVLALALGVAFWPRQSSPPTLSAWQSPTAALMTPPLPLSVDANDRLSFAETRRTTTTGWRSPTAFLLHGS